MKQVLYKNDIYPYSVRVLLGADEEYIVKTFANLEVETAAAFTDAVVEANIDPRFEFKAIANAGRR